MKKVLLIGNMWLYSQRSFRRPGLAKYLPEFNWEPIVITTPLAGKPELGYRVIEVPYHNMLNSWLKLLGLDTSKSIRKQVSQKLGITSKKSLLDFVFLRLREVLTYPDSNKGWKSPAIRAGSELLQKEDIRAIISASPPVMSSIIAKELKVKYKIPWVADFLHLWSQDHGRPYSSLRRMFDRRLELKTLSQADALVTINEPLATEFGRLHREKPIYVISHGFDPESVNIPPDKLTDKFTITYTGGFSPSIREPTKLFAALQKLILKGIIDPNTVEVRLFGPEEIWIDSDIKKYGLSGIVRQYGIVPMRVAHEKQRESQLLLIPKAEHMQQTGIISTKFFEYLAARRPILAIGGHKDIVDDMLNETGVGTCATSDEDIEQALEALYQEYKEKGELAFHGNTARINKYSQREMAGKFAEILNHFT